MKTVDELLLFLVRNSKPEYHVFPVSGDRKECLPESKQDLLGDLLLRLCGATRFTCPTVLVEEFLGEPLDFEKHLRSLHDEGTLRFQVAEPGTMYDSESYRQIGARTHGQIKDYKTSVSYVAFHYRENDFLGDYARVVADARALKLMK